MTSRQVRESLRSAACRTRSHADNDSETGVVGSWVPVPAAIAMIRSHRFGTRTARRSDGARRWTKVRRRRGIRGDHELFDQFLRAIRAILGHGLQGITLKDRATFPGVQRQGPSLLAPATQRLRDGILEPNMARDPGVETRRGGVSA